MTGLIWHHALHAACFAAADEIERSDPGPAAALRPMLTELTGAAAW